MKKILIIMICINLVLASTCQNKIFFNMEKPGLVSYIACGYWHSMIIDNKGNVYSWGANWYGQLGDGTLKSSVTPKQINVLTNIVSVSCGEAHSLALKSDGTVWAWGANFYGQLGDGTTENRTIPTQVKELNNVIAISCGDSHSMALKSNGTVWTWGYDFKGQLGNGSTENSAIPIQVSGINDITLVKAGLADSLALKKDGTVWVWGSNSNGQLGIGTTEDVFAPVKIDSLQDITSIACGGTHCLALKKDGTVWAWGSNGNGQLGNGTTERKILPVKIDKIADVISISCGDTSSMCLDKSGTVWAWGGGMPLGNGTTSSATIPEKVKNLQDILSICENYNHCMALMKDGSVWSWGKNWKGQIGNGSTKDIITPIRLNFSLLNVRSVQTTEIKPQKKDYKNDNKFNSSVNLSNLHQNPIFSQEWGLYNNGQTISDQKCKAGIDINIVPAWEFTTGSEAIVVGVLDTGIDIKHQDLKNNIFYNKNELLNNNIDKEHNGYIGDFNGWDFANNDNTVYDSNKTDYHGTMIAGIIAAKSFNKGMVGVAPNVKILPLKFMNGDTGYVSDAIKAIEYAKEQGVKIINCSWGWTNTKYNLVLEDAIESSDILFVCSAGNKRSNDSTKLFYPACFNLHNIISVTSINSNGILDPSSNYGKLIDVAAPGVGIISTAPENKYGLFSGTSAATPFVTGIAALLESYEPNISCSDVADSIKTTVHSYKELEGKVSSNGRVNAFAALKSVIEKEDSKQ